ncbi:hypothetical protein C8R46DRAFT_885316, partial [Mycena filopes]
FYSKYVRLPEADAPPPPAIRHNPKWWPYFRDMLGAIDGTHLAPILIVRPPLPIYTPRETARVVSPRIVLLLCPSTCGSSISQVDGMVVQQTPRCTRPLG